MNRDSSIQAIESVARTSWPGVEYDLRITLTDGTVFSVKHNEKNAAAYTIGRQIHIEVSLR